MAHKLDKELQEFRDLLKPPSTFEDGFSWTALMGALFIGLMMVPGAMYMHLVAGIGIEGAARWVTVILFLEVARRTNRYLKRAEIFVLFYMASVAIAAPFEGLLWRQFFVQSESVIANGWQSDIPWWWAPSDPQVLATRSFFSKEWLAPIGMIVLFNLVTRLDSRVVGYGLFKIASDYEKLPFPMAPVGAQGIIALAEEEDESSWRWKAFSVGGAVGLAFGLIYMGIPILSNAIFGVTMQPLPIPFVDWTSKTNEILPAVATGFSFDLTHFLIGMVMPWWAVVGAFIGLIITFVANPLLYDAGMLSLWRENDSTVVTLFKNTIDFYFSFGIGLSLAIAAVGIYTAIVAYFRAKAVQRAHAANPGAVDYEADTGPPPGRGDLPNWLVIAVYCCSCALYIGVSGLLVDWHRGVMIVMLFYAFLYTPIVSYVTARLEGMCGQALTIPLAREVGFILSGYQGLAVWFLPIPLTNYGEDTMFYRKAELTGTKFWSLWKTDLLLVPFILVCSIFFANFIWSLAPIPSQAYPYTQEIWEFQAKNQALVYSATMGEFSQFDKAINVWYIGAGFGLGTVAYAVLAVLGAPILLCYGFVRGMNQTMPHSVLPQFIGACLGQFYFKRKFGAQWRQYIPVVTAGFTCGMGLVSMFCIGVTFLSKSVFQLSY